MIKWPLSACLEALQWCHNERDGVSNNQPHDCLLNSLRPRQNVRYFADDVFKCIYLNENLWIWIKISLKFVPKGQVNNIPALVQIMALHRPGGKPLSESIMVSLLTQICVNRPQWVNRSFKIQIKENIKDPRHWPLWSPVIGKSPSRIASNAENVSIWWRHHGHRY